MINKQNLWFITLFSLILILGVYYISMPKDVLTTFSDIEKEANSALEITESDVLIALKVEEEEKMIAQMEDAQKILLDASASVEDKNAAYETLQLLNSQKGKTQEIEKKIKEKFNVDSVVTLDGNKINVTLTGENKGKEYANNIIKEVQSLYEVQMYITVKFQ